MQRPGTSTGVGLSISAQILPPIQAYASSGDAFAAFPRTQLRQILAISTTAAELTLSSESFISVNQSGRNLLEKGRREKERNVASNAIHEKLQAGNVINAIKVKSKYRW